MTSPEEDRKMDEFLLRNEPNTPAASPYERQRILATIRDDANRKSGFQWLRWAAVPLAVVVMMITAFLWFNGSDPLSSDRRRARVDLKDDETGRVVYAALSGQEVWDDTDRTIAGFEYLELAQAVSP